ncbi:MAG TPA: hypothetical protein DDW27_09325 [Bacteroidales bacterium]|nr:hypothetical protein [Bacteroidales bacterium]
MLNLSCEKLQSMKSLLISLGVLLFLNSPVTEAQTNVKIRKKDFKTVKEGFKEAWSHVSAGDDYFKERSIWYGSAYDEYRQAMVYNNVNPELNYKTGVAALYSDNKEAAADFLLKALGQDNELTDDILLMTGRALQYAGRYDEAINTLNDYLNSDVRKAKNNLSDAAKYLQECNSAIELIKDTLSVEILNVGTNLNSFADDYSPAFSSDFNTIFFATRREIKRSSISLTDGKYDENIFQSNRVNGNWNMASSAIGRLNTAYCESPLYLAPSGDELYVYTGYQNGGDIKLSIKEKGIWKSPVSAPFKINTGGAETSLTFSPSGNEVWFVTTKGKNSLGGKDIYFIRKTPKFKWSGPQNAGPNINTPFDEESVRFSEYGDTLWFSSRGHNTIGGYDVFYSVKDSSGGWSKAVNCGYPVNTPWDELFFNPDKNEKGAFYLVSNRKGTAGGLDIFHGRNVPVKTIVQGEPVQLPPEPPDTIIHRVIVESLPVKPDTVVVKDTVVVIREITPAPVLLPEAPKEIVLYLTGRVNDSETGDPVMAKVDVIDISNDMVIGTTASSDMDGSYRIKLPAKKSYMIDFRGTGFLSDMKRIDIPENYSAEFYRLDMPLVKVKVGKKVVLNNILFQTGKAILTAGSYTELDRLAGILQENSLMRIEISGHTDNTGSLGLNSRLSEERAKAVVDYLIQKGISSERLEFRGYGPQQPIADNTSAEGRARNRRVEFKILEF